MCTAPVRAARAVSSAPLCRRVAKSPLEEWEEAGQAEFVGPFLDSGIGRVAVPHKDVTPTKRWQSPRRPWMGTMLKQWADLKGRIAVTAVERDEADQTYKCHWKVLTGWFASKALPKIILILDLRTVRTRSRSHEAMATGTSRR